MGSTQRREPISPQQAGLRTDTEPQHGAAEAAETPGGSLGLGESGFHPCSCGREASKYRGLALGAGS